MSRYIIAIRADEVSKLRDKKDWWKRERPFMSDAECMKNALASLLSLEIDANPEMKRILSDIKMGDVQFMVVPRFAKRITDATDWVHDHGDLWELTPEGSAEVVKRKN